MFSKSLFMFKPKNVQRFLRTAQIIKNNKSFLLSIYFQLKIFRFFMNHIKNVLEENRKVEAQEIYNEPLIEEDARVYKPSYTIDLNREGEVLLFSCDPIMHVN